MHISTSMILFLSKNLTTMINKTTIYFNSKHTTLSLFLSDFWDICDPVFIKKDTLWFYDTGYVSLRKPEDNCKINIQFMYLMDNKQPTYRTFGHFINEMLADEYVAMFNMNHCHTDMDCFIPHYFFANNTG